MIHQDDETRILLLVNFDLNGLRQLCEPVIITGFFFNEKVILSKELV